MKSLFATFMLLFFLMGQINLTWAKHFCDDKLVSSELTLSTKAKDCCAKSSGKTPMDCCEDKIASADSDDFFGKTGIEFDVSLGFILSFVYSFDFSLSENLEIEFSKPKSPDPFLKDLYLLYETFLI